MGKNKDTIYPINKPRGQEYIIHDSVHGTITFDEQEKNIIDSIVFQRLRNISHLGTTSFVYPSATQTRFAHSLGTMHLMGKVAAKLVDKGIITNDDLIKLRLAALLHDVGHFPFSHKLENPIKSNFQQSKTEFSDPNVGDHEDFSNHLIINSSIKDQFTTVTASEIAAILKKRYSRSELSLLISSDLDVDRMDYLLRDAHETGVSYGVIDVDRLLHTITFTEDKSHNYTHLAVIEKGKQAIENFLLARYHMYQTVYKHKTISGFSELLAKIYEKMLTNELAYTYNDLIKLTDEEIYDFNDHYVWNLFKEHRKKEEYKEFISSFMYRHRLKTVRDINAITSDGTYTKEHAKLIQLENPLILNDISEKSEVPIDWILYEKPNPLAIQSDPEGEKAIYLIPKNGDPLPIAHDTTSLVSQLYKGAYFSARVFTNEKNYERLDKTIKKELKV